MVERNERPEFDERNHRIENRRLEERRVEARRQMHRRKSGQTTLFKYIALVLLIAAFIAAFSV